MKMGLERILIALVVYTAVTLVIIQVLQINDPMRQAAVPVTVPKQYGAAGETVSVLQKHAVTFQLKNYSLLPMARVLVNNEPRGIFDNRYVTVLVGEGDMIKIDGTRYDRAIDIEVLDVSKGVVLPAAGSEFRVEGNVVAVGKVCLNH
ncbi:MAG: putative membrane protein [Pelotomaculum thermopropionicum]|uniref:Putative membrane protein n=1 Tax=Pelotomaculum thermopropionicum TaxID=110500 RepID=A0A101HQR0_9FIRM|nr:MAG: putative membrane protein [Pelotomaculum thermopropionicum]